MTRTILQCASTVILAASVHAGQKMDVTIIDRRDMGSRYSYVVPGSSSTSSTANVGCLGAENSANCSGSAASTTSSTPPRVMSYDVAGATLALQLPDGRIAVVNCESKVNLTDFSRMNQQRRSCRIPLVNKIEADFDGSSAKLKWPVSIDGKKFQSENYKILAVIDKP